MIDIFASLLLITPTSLQNHHICADFANWMVIFRTNVMNFNFCHILGMWNGRTCCYWRSIWRTISIQSLDSHHLMASLANVFSSLSKSTRMRTSDAPVTDLILYQFQVVNAWFQSNWTSWNYLCRPYQRIMDNATTFKKSVYRTCLPRSILAIGVRTPANKGERSLNTAFC